MEEWSARRIGDVCLKVTSGGTPNTSVSEYYEGGTIPWLKTAEVTKGRIYSTEESIAQKGLENSAAKWIPKNSVIVAMYGETAGRVAINKIALTTNQACCNLLVDGRLADYQYVYYCLKGNYSNLFGLRLGGAQQNLNARLIRDFQVVLPPLPTQRKIAAILSAYDELIENNRRRIALLERMAEEIYREWFVRLRFPGHEEVRVVKGVPEGWEVSRVGSLGAIVTGKTPSTSVSRYYGCAYHFVKTPDMHGKMFVLETDQMLTEEGLQSQSSQTIPPNALCVSCIGSGGVVSITTEICQTNQQINSIVLSELTSLEWAYYALRSLKESILLFGGTGTTMTNLSKGKFSSMKLIVPPRPVRGAFHGIAHPIFTQIKNLMVANRLLSRSRDLLLPRLISGKLSVEDLDIAFPPGMAEETAPSETPIVPQEELEFDTHPVQ